MSTTESVYDVPQDVFFDDVYTFPQEECCPRTSMLFDQQGFREAFALDFGTATAVVLGKYTAQGTIAFADVEGEFHRHDWVPLSAMAPEYAETVPLYRGRADLTRAYIKPLSGVPEIMLSGESVASVKDKLLLEKVNALSLERLTVAVGPQLKEAAVSLVKRREGTGHYRSLNEVAEVVGENAFYAMVDKLDSTGRSVGAERAREGALPAPVRIVRGGGGGFSGGFDLRRLAGLLGSGAGLEAVAHSAGGVDAQKELAEAMAALILRGLQSTGSASPSPEPSAPEGDAASPAPGDPIDIE